MEIGFVLKKIIGGAMMPLSVILLLLLLAFVLLLYKHYTKAKISLGSAIVLLFLLSYNPVVNTLLDPLEKKYPTLHTVEDTIKYICVLGSGHSSNDSLGIVSQLSSTALARTTQGIIYHKKAPHTKLIFSGYKGNDTTAHAFMQKRLALQLGVKEKNIITLPSPKDTAQEAQAIQKIVKNSPFVLVTSASHLPRAMKTFEKVGLHPTPAPTQHLKSNNDFFKRAKASDLEKSEIAMWEYLGITFLKIKNLF